MKTKKICIAFYTSCNLRGQNGNCNTSLFCENQRNICPYKFECYLRHEDGYCTLHIKEECIYAEYEELEDLLKELSNV
jgi:hypothetical protein